ncbi:DUF402 domain-containing protein [Mycoplasmopsis ciconiae]|uniref:DUF402 domain-containing protein n=1 Tax=Mycoplasmopsis ciconiae TaxID=561067 RepID=A0ABU7MKR7_9BACT|nr:DUF402 domain-containing protein [Mycoplasmopsis ciconiae]
MKNRFTSLKVNDVITVQAYKFNGQLYRQWNKAKVLVNSEKHIVLLMYKTHVSERDNKSWTYREHVLWFFSKKSLYNALILLKKNGFYTYINLASTPIYEENTLKFIDYDLDVKCYPGKDLKIVDREEFYHNSRRFKYPKTLEKNVFFTLKNLLEMYNNYQYFFNPKLIKYFMTELDKDKAFINPLNGNRLLEINEVVNSCLIKPYPKRKPKPRRNKVNQK